MKNPEPSSSYKQEDSKDPVGPRHLSDSQSKAFVELDALFSLAGHHETYGGYSPRSRPLIVGSSGCGKTALVKRLVCDTHRLPLLPVSCASWVPAGCSQPNTLPLIGNFVRRHPQGAIFLDELDKCASTHRNDGNHLWSLSVASDLIALLDGDDRLLSAGWCREDVRRLSGYFIIAAGAWQEKVKVRTMDVPSSHPERIKKDFGIMPEIALRFNSRLISIAAPSPRDFAEGINRIHRDLSLPILDSEKLALRAVYLSEQGCGMRALEAYLSDLLLMNPSLRRATRTNSPSDSRETISAGELEKMFAILYPLLESLEFPLCACRLRLRNCAARLLENPAEDVLKFSRIKTASKLDELLMRLVDGCHFRFSIDDDEREIRIESLQKDGAALADFFEQTLKSAAHIGTLKKERLVTLMLKVQVKLRRMLEIIRYTSGKEVV